MIGKHVLYFVPDLARSRCFSQNSYNWSPDGWISWIVEY